MKCTGGKKNVSLAMIRLWRTPETESQPPEAWTRVYLTFSGRAGGGKCRRWLSYTTSSRRGRPLFLSPPKRLVETPRLTLVLLLLVVVDDAERLPPSPPPPPPPLDKRALSLSSDGRSLQRTPRDSIGRGGAFSRKAIISIRIRIKQWLRSSSSCKGGLDVGDSEELRANE
ncbi:hypothetical protein V1478_010652, partial [Vespula squamosa]